MVYVFFHVTVIFHSFLSLLFILSNKNIVCNDKGSACKFALIILSQGSWYGRLFSHIRLSEGNSEIWSDFNSSNDKNWLSIKFLMFFQSVCIIVIISALIGSKFLIFEM